MILEEKMQSYKELSKKVMAIQEKLFLNLEINPAVDNQPHLNKIMA